LLRAEVARNNVGNSPRIYYSPDTVSRIRTSDSPPKKCINIPYFDGKDNLFDILNVLDAEQSLLGKQAPLYYVCLIEKLPRGDG